MKKSSLKCWLVVGAMCLTMVGCGQSETAVDEAVVVEEVTDGVVTDAEMEENAEVEADVVDEETPEAKAVLDDGIYVAKFDTDSGMFHVNEANEGKGILTVKDGEMTIHVSLAGTRILNLYPGLAEEAQKDGAVLLDPTTDTVTYSDGTSEEVYGFDVPVPYLDEEFDLALIGSKGKWYDHKVSVSDPVLGDDLSASEEAEVVACGAIDLDDGEYEVEIAMEGGSGKATIESPAKLVVKDGIAVVTITWSSPNYDYMLLDGEKYEPINTEGNSVFELPISTLDAPIDVIGDTTAMSKPHEVEYKITCSLK